MISHEEFQKLDLQVATILKVEAVEDADKLFRVTVELGDEQRVIVSGLREYYSSEDLTGKKVILLANLESKKIRGIDSKGMLLAAWNREEKKLSLLTIDRDIEDGTKVY